MLREQSSILYVLGAAVRCSVKCWIRLTTLSSLLDFEISRLLFTLKSISMEHSTVAQKTLEILDGKLQLLTILNRAATSSAEQGRVRTSNYCALLSGMLNTFDHSTKLARLTHALLTVSIFSLMPNFHILWGTAQEFRKV